MALIGLRTELPEDQVVHRVVEGHALATPDACAVTSGPFSLTFAELNERANLIAHRLLALGVGRGSVVGICLVRGIELVPAIVGVLKTGSAYVPLDPTYPPARIGLMIEQLPAGTTVISEECTRSLVGGCAEYAAEGVDAVAAVDIAALTADPATGPTINPEVKIDNDDLCYVVFTSGSTGTPKPAAIRHRNWFNLLRWLQTEHGLDASSNGLCVSSFGFDITQRAIMAPLFTGACSHLLASRYFDARMACRTIENHQVATLHLAPSTLYALIETAQGTDRDALGSLRHAFIGGEPLNAERVRQWSRGAGARCALWHQYGVAESTDVASAHLLHDVDRYARSAPPVGKPVHNTTVHICDEQQREVPDGNTGEIVITGNSVGAGYLNAATTGDDPFTDIVVSGRPTSAYRTGDRGYVDEAGELVVVGRNDHQVKVRGMRIDLGDVEHAVCRSDGVQDAAVVAVRDTVTGEAQLVAYVVPTPKARADGGGAGADDDPDRQLRKSLFRSVPRNMVPEHIVLVEALPLSPNGKVDRLALSARRATSRS